MRKILDVFEVFLGIIEKTKEKKDRELRRGQNYHYKSQQVPKRWCLNVGL